MQILFDTHGPLRQALIRLKTVQPASPFFLQPIVSEDGRLRISPGSLARFYDLASRHLDDVRVLPQAQSERIMGWEFGNAGMQLVLSPRLPAVVKEELWTIAVMRTEPMSAMKGLSPY